MLDVVWDMETSDPDDFLTLLLLLGHPAVRLKAVTITPGSREQVGLVRRALGWFELDLPVGAFRPDNPKPCVSEWHYKAYGLAEPADADEPGAKVLRRACDEHTTLLTGGPLKNLGAAMELPDFHVGRLVAQGGFAGEGVVPAEDQLPAFRGRTTCPTFNFNGDTRSALQALTHPTIGARRFVSKNVCHGVIYDHALQAKVVAAGSTSLSHRLMAQGMELVLKKYKGGKMFHDPFAACCAIDPSIATWAEVELYREKGEWGSRLCPGSGTFITTGYNRERFEQVLLAVRLRGTSAQNQTGYLLCPELW